MEDETKLNKDSQNETGEETKDSAGGELTFDQWLDSNPAFRSEFDRRNTKAVQTARSNWEREQEENQSEAKRLEKMTAAQRERYQLDKDKEAFALEQEQFARQQMLVAVGADLQKRGLSADLARFLAGKTADESQANLDEFESIWNQSLTSSINGRMRGDGAPKEPRKAETADPFLSGFQSK